MAKNPKRTLDALTGGGENVRGVVVREITMGLSAVLEAIDSPLVTGVKPETLAAMLPTLFVMTRPAAESQRLLTSGGIAALTTAAVEWSDGFSTEHGLEMCAACGRAVRRVARVSPQGVPEKDGDGVDGRGGPQGNAGAAGTAG